MAEVAVQPLDRAFEDVVGTLGGPATKVDGLAGDLFMEIMDTRDMSVWMCLQPVTDEQYKALKVEFPWMKSGRAPAAMDRAAFAHSPNKPDEFSSVECDGLTFRHVAYPTDFNPAMFQQTGPIRLPVKKHHTLGYAAGRDVTVMDLNGEVFVEVIGDSESDSELELPAGASLRTVALDQPMIVRLPTPTITHFWFGKARSFQGPVGNEVLKP